MPIKPVPVLCLVLVVASTFVVGLDTRKRRQTFTAVREYFLGFPLNYLRNAGAVPSLLLLTSETTPVTCVIDVPNLGQTYNVSIVAGNETFVELPDDLQTFGSSTIDNKGIHVQVDSNRVVVIGQNFRPERGGDPAGTYLALPTLDLNITEYTYFELDMVLGAVRWPSQILVVGTQSNTTMNITVTQPVRTIIDGVTEDLVAGMEYSYNINRLQTFYITHPEDLTGSKIVTDKPISLFSGHVCAILPSTRGDCDHMIEQSPPTAMWGMTFYVAPIPRIGDIYYIRVLAANDATEVNVYCNNTEESFTIHEGEFIHKELPLSDHCAIHSNKKVLVAQYASSPGYPSDPAMVLVPATIQYSNRILSSTASYQTDLRYIHSLIVIVLAEHFNPNLIYMNSGGNSESLDTYQWVPIQANNVVEAYYTHITNISTGSFEVFHVNQTALLNTVLFGFSRSVHGGYGHAGRLEIRTGTPDGGRNVSQPEVPVNASRPDAPVNVRIPEINVTHESFVVQWDAVMDVSSVNYTVTWLGEDDGINGTATVNALSYTVTGLTENTSYSVAVFAINTCCGSGPASEVITVTTEVLPTTLPPVTQPPPANETFTAVREYFLGFPLNYLRNAGAVPSLLLLTSETTPVTCVIDVPNLGQTYNVSIVAGNETFVELPDDLQTFGSSTIDNKGIHVQVDSNRVVVIGQNFRPERGGDPAGTYLALPTLDLNITEYTYFELDMVLGAVRWPSQILVVGTQSNTTMNITVTQPVRTIIDGVTEDLVAGMEYSYNINRLQTFYITHPEDLTGSKIVTDKPISLFSGHVCAILPSTRGDCDHMVEQSPPTAMWGMTFYVAPIPRIGDIYYIRVLAANDATEVNVYCNNTEESFTIHEGEFIHKELPLSDHCAIHSNKKVLVAQYASSPGYPSDPAMVLVPATIQYSNRILSSTASYQTDLRYIHSLIVIVLAEHFNPNLIYMNSGGNSESLDTYQWVPIQANNVVEAYYTHITNISTGSFEVFHVNQTALLNTVLFGFSRSVHGGYGHAGRLEIRTGTPDGGRNVSQPEVPVNASRPDAPVNVRIPEINVTHESFVVQWDAVMDVSSVNYTVTWLGEDDGINGTATVNALSYTVTGLTENTSYSVAVFAINTCCGSGPASEVITVTTEVLPTTLPPVTQPPPANETFTAVREYFLGFPLNYLRNAGAVPSLLLLTSETTPVTCVIDVPNLGQTYNVSIVAGNETFVELPDDLQTFGSSTIDNKGIHVQVDSNRVVVIGQNFRPERGGDPAGTYLALPTLDLNITEYTYFELDMVLGAVRWPSQILVVGTQSNTTMNITVTQPVRTIIDGVTEDLVAGMEYSYNINRLQTFYITHPEDLTGSKIVTDKPISLFSGHVCAILPSTRGDCDHMIEQSPPTAMWGMTFYVAPIPRIGDIYYIRVLAANDATEVNVYCNNTEESFTIHEGEFIHKELPLSDHCAIHSNKKVLVAQYASSPGYPSDPAMVLVPATIQYSNRILSSTASYQTDLRYIHSLIVIVLAEHFNPNLIYMNSGGNSESLDTYQWVPIQANNVVEAYYTHITNISTGSFEVFHVNQTALLNTVLFGFSRSVHGGYGHAGRLEIRTGTPDGGRNVSQPEVPVNASRPDAPVNVRIPEINVTHESFVVQWDAVMDVSSVNYTVTWLGEDDGINGTATVNALSYTVTGLTENTSYSVAVFAINTCCGSGPASEVITVTTEVLPTTLPPVTQPPPANETFTAVREYFLGFPLNYLRNAGAVPSLLLLTSETTPVTCVIDVPNLGQTYNVSIVAGNETFVELPDDLQTFGSSTIDNKGIHVQVDSNRVVVIGQNFRPERGGDPAGTYLALPTLDLNITEYTYFELDMVLGAVRWPSQILVVGTQSNTTMNITVTQPVRTIIDGVTEDLVAGMEYSYNINRLQTFYITHPEDLTGSKIVTDKPISLFSGHVCAILPSTRGDCDHMIEQSPPTAMWGMTFYVAPIPRIGDIYYIRVLAANDATEVNVYCNNTEESFTIHEGEFIHKELPLSDHCAIHSNKKVLVAQYASSPGYPSDPAMVLVPATIQYSNRILSSTASYQTDLRYIHSLIVIVLAEHFNPNLIYMNSGGNSESLDTYQWVPIQANNVVEAYYTHITNISTGSFEVFHVNQTALLNTVLFGFSRSVHGGYGHAGRLEIRTGTPDGGRNVSQPEVPVNASRPDAPVNVRIPEINVTHESFVVQWDAVMDVSSVNYTVTWLGEDDGINGTATVNALSYTVTGLTENTSYSVAVFAINTCCGSGPASEVITVTTEVLPTTLPPVTQPPPANETFTAVREYFLGFPLNYLRNAGAVPSLLLLTSETTPVTCVIDVPNLGQTYNVSIVAGNETFVELPDDLQTFGSSTIDNKGIHVQVDSNRVVVIGQNFRPERGGDPAGTYLALPTLDLNITEYTYFELDMVLGAVRWPSQILVVGTQSNTTMNITVTQPVRTIIDGVTEDLVAGMEYSYNINRLQTFYITHPEDLTGSKIVTDKPISLFSGHVCAILPSTRGDCDHMIEQSPPTAMWGMTFYVAPIPRIGDIYYIRVLAANDATEVNVYCNNTEESFTIHEGEFIHKELPLSDHCAIHSNKKVLVAQYASSPGYPSDPAMVLVPATIQYSNRILSSTASYQTDLRYIHSLIVIVLAEHFNPNLIYMNSGGNSESLDTYQWVPIQANNVVEAYYTHITNISTGSFEVFHVNQTALLNTVLFGFSRSVHGGYGHAGRLEIRTGTPDGGRNVSQPEVPVNASRPDAPVNVRIPEINVTHESFVVQWDAVMDVSSVNYTVTWLGEDDGINGTATVNALSYTVTGLTENTSYSVAVFAINTCCGSGPASEVITVTTEVLPTTLPPVTQPPPANETFTAVREYFLGFPLNYLRNAGAVPSLLLLTSETTPVTCVIDVPNLGQTYNVSIVAGNETFVELPDDLQTFGSSTIDNKGIHVQVDSNRVVVIGQNFRPERGGDPAGTYLALPTLDLNITEYTYFELDMVLGAVRWPSQILVVGTQSNTTMNITVTQPVRTIIDGVTEDLVAGMEYSYNINRLQTFYITHPEDLTGSKIVTDKPISLFSGHVCAILPSTRGDCDHMIEQSPPTAMWGMTFYVAPIPRIGDIYYIRVLAANDATEVNVYCNNTEESFTIHEGEFIHKELPLSDHCAIHSNKKVLVAQYASSPGYPSDPAMVLVPATIQYSNRILSSTASYQTDLRYIHSLIVIVLAEHFNPNLIYMNSGGNSESLDTYQWVPIQANNVVEAYYTHITNISTGSFEVFHVNQTALLNTVLFGFSRSVHGGYGHAGRLEIRTELTSTRLNATTSTVPVISTASLVSISTVLDIMTSTIELIPSLSMSSMLDITSTPSLSTSSMLDIATSTIEIITTPMLSTADYTSIQPTSALPSVVASTVEISDILPSLAVSVISYPTVSPSPSLLPIEITALQQSINYYVEDGDSVSLLVSLNNADFVQNATVELFYFGGVEFLTDNGPEISAIDKVVSDNYLMYDGNASVADYLSILNNVTYTHTGQNFTINQRIIVITVYSNGLKGSTNISINFLPLPLISFADQRGVIPNVVILYRAEGQFVIDGLNLTSRMSIFNEDLQELHITLVNDNTFSEINVDEITARNESRIPYDLHFNYSGNGRYITVYYLDANATVLAVRSLTYTYNSTNLPEPVFNTSNSTISITLVQGDINSTINFTVRYRGDNLAAPVLSYNTTDGSVKFREGDDGVIIINGSVSITDTDHPTYMLQSARAEIDNYTDQDQLSTLTKPPSLHCNYNNGVLSITGTASIEDYITAISNIVYDNIADEPLNDVKTIRITVTDSELFSTTMAINNPWPIANSSTSNSVEIFVTVENTDDPPRPILNNLYLTEVAGLVKINLTTVDSADPQDYYTNASLVLMPVYSEIESISFNRAYPSGITVTLYRHSIIVAGLGSKLDYNAILCNIFYHWNSTNGNLDSGDLILTVTDLAGTTVSVKANISIDDVIDHKPILGFAANDVDRNSVVYPTTLASNKFIEYNIDESIYFLNDTYLRDDRQLKNVSIEVITAVPTTDQLPWNETFQRTLGISFTNRSSGLTAVYTFSGNVSNVLDWEMFLMSFSFLQSEPRVANRNVGNRTINIRAQDYNYNVTVTVIINVLPLPPVVLITVQDTTFTEGQNFIWLQNEFPIAVIQDEDAMFVSLTVTLWISGEGNYLLGDTEMLYSIMPPIRSTYASLGVNITSKTSTAHVVEFTNSNGISNEFATMAIRSIIYLNYEPEPLAFDNTGAPLFREIAISAVDTLLRPYETSFKIEILPVNDNRPVIRLFTSDDCSSSSMVVPSRKKRRNLLHQSKEIKQESTIQQEHHKVPYITRIYGNLTDQSCAACIIIHFSAPVTHPYVDMWSRLSLVLSFSPQYLNDQKPIGIWESQDVLIVTFSEHNCSKWNYIDTQITFNQLNKPCQSSPLECITGICYANYTGCRIIGTFTFNFTNNSRRTTTTECLYSPTSSPLFADTLVLSGLSILISMMIFIFGAMFITYFMWKCMHVSKKLNKSQEDKTAPGIPVQSSKLTKHKKKQRLNKPFTIAQLAATSAAKQHVSTTAAKHRSCYHYKDDDDYTLPFLHKTDDIIHNSHCVVKEIASEKDATTVTTVALHECKVIRRIKGQSISDINYSSQEIAHIDN